MNYGDINDNNSDFDCAYNINEFIVGLRGRQYS